MNHFVRAALFCIATTALAACGPVPHPFSAHKDNPLLDDRRVTAAVQVAPVREFPGLDEALVKELARHDVLASTHEAGHRTVHLHGGIENGNLVWRLNDPDQHELGVLSQAIAAGEPPPALAHDAAPIVIQLLTAGGIGPDDPTRPHIAVLPVRGPNGTDTRPLSQAMADALAAEGIALGGEHPVASVEGVMEVLTASGGEPLVEVDWTVRDAKGRSLGTVSQGSPVSRDTLAGPLTDLGRDIATAASPGVVEVLRKKVPGALQQQGG
jgi:hypothetical protein